MFIALLVSVFQVQAATNVVLLLKNGDRVAGAMISEDTNRVVIATDWIESLAIPRTAITNFQIVPNSPAAVVAATVTNAPITTNAQATAPVIAAKPVAPAATNKPPPAVAQAAKPAPKHWKANLTFGADVQTGAKDRDLYYTRMKFTYEEPLRANPKKLVRTTLDYSADYGETDGEKSVNRMYGSLKFDRDIMDGAYVYALGGAGYDEIRKIDFQAQAGPGLGYHLFRKPAFGFDLESGLDYQQQIRVDSDDTRSLYARLAEIVTWKPAPRVTFTERFEFYPNLQDGDNYRSRLESTLSVGLSQFLSLNLSVINNYDTDPVRGVDKNEFLLRTSLGVSF